MKKLLFLLIISAASCTKDGSSRPKPQQQTPKYFQVEEVSVDGNIYLSETVKVL